jgi:hypothetical protein
VTFVVLFILAVVWAVYLVSWIRSRTEHRRVNSISSFSNHLSILERSQPKSRSMAPVASGSTALRGGAYFAPHRPKLSQQKKRRRDILFGLLAATGVTALGAFFLGGIFTVLFVLSFLLTAAFVTLLASAQKRSIERRTKVHYIAETAAPASAARAGGSRRFADDEDEESLPRMYVVGGN